MTHAIPEAIMHPTANRVPDVLFAQQHHKQQEADVGFLFSLVLDLRSQLLFRTHSQKPTNRTAFNLRRGLQHRGIFLHGYRYFDYPL